MAAVTTGAQRVVVADDSRLMRRILSDALGRQGFDVVATAADGDEALAACREHRPDAMTLDLAMPGLDGIGVLRALKAGKAEPVPVIVVSAFSPAHGARAVDALAEGAFDLVAKPAMGESMESFTVELARKVNDAAEGGKLRRRVRRPPPARRCARPRPVPRRARAGDAAARADRLLDRRPEGAGRAGAQAAVAARRRLADRPAHAGRLHRFAGRAAGQRVAADRRRGRGRRDDRPAPHVHRPRRRAPADGRRPPRPAERRRADGRPASARGPDDRRRRRDLRLLACCWSC